MELTQSEKYYLVQKLDKEYQSLAAIKNDNPSFAREKRLKWIRSLMNKISESPIKNGDRTTKDGS